ncbi:hypothetical protein FHH43_01430 [Clostridium perfringens]|nr:hypothetical protein [Clostridium perfringens]
MKVICEECKKEFQATNDMIKVNYLGSMKTEVTYNCPNCGQRFIVGVMSTKARKLKRAMEKLRVVIDGKLRRGYKECNEQKVIKDLGNQLLAEMNKYSRGDKYEF